jgi:hypothetical protein
LTAIVTVRRAGGPHPPGIGDAEDAGHAAALENGDVLFLPDARFDVGADEAAFFSPAILSSAKNTGFDPATGRVTGTSLSGEQQARLGRMMLRFSDAAARLVHDLLPRYRGHVRRARASFRPAEIAGRVSSWRKDDTRLHVDSFPATPTHGARILRLFANVNPDGRPRAWRVGGRFEAVAERFAGRLSMPWPASATVLRLLHLTKTRRTAYDALMLQLHDRMKADADFQARSPQASYDFPAGSTWMAFTDQVSHAALSGQYQLEQTFLLPVNAMIDETCAPLRVLEKLKGRALL